MVATFDPNTAYELYKSAGKPNRSDAPKRLARVINQRYIYLTKTSDFLHNLKLI
jgi:hypothetical protein